MSREPIQGGSVHFLQSQTGERKEGRGGLNGRDREETFWWSDDCEVMMKNPAWRGGKMKTCRERRTWE